MTTNSAQHSLILSIIERIGFNSHTKLVMVDPIITPTVISVVTTIVTSEPFKEFGLSFIKGIGRKSGEGFYKALTGGSNSPKSSDSAKNSAYQAAMQKYLQAKQAYLDKDINLREREFAAREEFSQNLLHLLGDSQQQNNETKLREIQNNWDQDTWFSKLDRQETESILRQAEHRLLILASPPDISSDCPDTFENNLNKEIKNGLGRFLGQYYPVNSSIHPVQFYGDYFKEPISSIDVKRLQSLLEGLSTVILYSDITDYEVNFNLDCLGGGETHQYPLPAWNWEDSYKALKQEGKSEKEALRAIRKMIVDVYLLLSAFISDWYYLQINLLYQPQLSQASVKLPDEWVTPCLEQLDKGITLKNLNRIEEAKTAFDKAFKLKPNLFTDILPNGVELEMVSIPAGEFMMGSNEFSNAKPIHKVTLKAFYMSKYPITQAQYQAVMGNNPSRFKGENHPVECVSWDDAQAFCRKLSQMTGKTYQLPSEAQWEYACRAGSTTKWCFGDDEGQLEDYAWYDFNSNNQTHPVGQKKPNNWGLYDMHGNVWEWCEDDYVNNYENTPRDGTAYKNKPMNFIVLRGGSWYVNPVLCRSANRFINTRDPLSNSIGFRVVCVVGR